MSAISLAYQPKIREVLNSAQVVVSRRTSRALWYVSLAALGAWAAFIAASISIYVQPAPRVHDEFSYMLAGDTILHGRLANPTPPAWEALQSFHTVMQPNYASKYPVGVGLLVALGMLFQTPLASSWLAAGLMTICITWMVAGVLSKRWAMLGGVLISLSPFVQLAWSQSLLHGFLPASGSALLMGGVLRLRRRITFLDALISGCGVGLLAISRPFEGLCCTLICVTILWLAWGRFSLAVRSKMAIQAASFALAPILTSIALIAAHNQAVTGNWYQMPYQLHETQYGVAPLFVFLPPKLENTMTRADLPEVVHEYHAVDSLNWYHQRVGLIGWLRGVNDACRELIKLSFPFIGIVALSGLRWTRYRLPQSLAFAIVLQVAASATVCWVFSHYLAPILPWLLLMTLISVRVSLRQGSKVLTRLVGLTVSAVLLVQVVTLVVFAGDAKNNEAELWSRQRQSIIERLNAKEGKHLVLVRYSSKHNVHQEWVYNLADPGASKIVWARYEDGRWLSSLLQAYPERSVWIIDAEDPNPTLTAMPKSGAEPEERLRKTE